MLINLAEYKSELQKTIFLHNRALQIWKIKKPEFYTAPKRSYHLST